MKAGIHCFWHEDGHERDQTYIILFHLITYDIMVERWAFTFYLWHEYELSIHDFCRQYTFTFYVGYTPS